MTNFTPISSLVGGGLIGVSASILWGGSGRVAGISGILGGLLGPRPADAHWRLVFLGGLLVGGLILAVLRPGAFGATPASLPWTAASGLLVGFGTRMGGGCTSGHGVCGVSRLSPRSLAATGVFMASGILSALLAHHLAGARP